VNIIDQCVAQGVPFAREYGGCSTTAPSAARRCRAPSTPAARPASSSCSAPTRRSSARSRSAAVKMYPRTRCSTSSWSTAARAASSCATCVTGEITSHAGRRGRARHRRLRQRLLPLDQRQGLQRHRRLARHKRGALFANPCFTQIHPTCIPVSGDYQSKLTLMSESLRNDGRVWVPKKAGRDAAPPTSPRASATTTSSGSTRASATSCRATSPRARPRRCATRGAASAPTGSASTSTSPTRSSGWAATRSRALRQPLRDVREDHRRGPVRDADAHLPGGPLHDGRPLGGLQPDEQHPGPARARRGQLLRPRRQPPRRERPHAGPGRRLLRHPVHHRRLPRREARKPQPVDTDHPEFKRRPRPRCGAHRALLSIKGKRTVDSFHRELGKIMWDKCGMARDAEGLEKASREIPRCARSSEEREGARERRRAEPVAREGGPRGRLPRVRRADVPRRAAPRGVCGGHFRDRAPDEDGEACATTKTSPRRRLGVQGEGAPAAAQGAARLRERPAPDASYK
jgi:succinate dehydrogenase / fumarate reductase flavoprotein subunit